MNPLNVLFLKELTKNVHENEQVKSRTTYRKLFLTLRQVQVDKLNFVESVNYICFESEHRFYIFGKFKVRDFHKTSTKNAAVRTQTSNQMFRSLETQMY